MTKPCDLFSILDQLTDDEIDEIIADNIALDLVDAYGYGAPREAGSAGLEAMLRTVEDLQRELQPALAEVMAGLSEEQVRALHALATEMGDRASKGEPLSNLFTEAESRLAGIRGEWDA